MLTMGAVSVFQGFLLCLTSVSGLIEVKSEGCIILTDHRKSWMQAERMLFYRRIYIEYHWIQNISSVE